MSEDQNREMIEKGMTLSTDSLAALHDAHLIQGFAVVVDLGEEKYAAAACCPAHMAELVDPEIASGSNDPRVREFVQLRSIDALSRLLGGTSESPYAAFREPFPTPRDVPDAGPVERSQEASDDVRESDAGMFNRPSSDACRKCDDLIGTGVFHTGPCEPYEGTGMYL